jgi:hypothetical protein
MDAWVDREVDGGDFPDRRLRARLGKLLGDLGRRIGGTLPAVCQDWAATKAAYRFFSNPRVDEGVILAGGTSPPPRRASVRPPARPSCCTTRPSSASGSVGTESRRNGAS